MLSAHRMPDEMFAFAESARERGLRAIIAGAGGAAHLPGMLAAKTTVPVLGVPVPSRHLGGQDSLYSIVQMPAGVPVATFAIGEAGATNAALFAVALLAARRPTSWPARSTHTARQRHDDAAAAVLPPAMITPPATLGILGGGQLGRYFVDCGARRWATARSFSNPTPYAPAGKVADDHIVAAVRRPGGAATPRIGVRRRHDRVREPSCPAHWNGSARGLPCTLRRPRSRSRRTDAPRRRSFVDAGMPWLPSW